MVNRVYAAYFSGTGTTEKVVKAISQKIADELCIKYEEWDFTPLFARKNEMVFTENDIVVFGMPVIAGRVPNLMLPYLNTIRGNGAVAVPVVLFGNRNYDDALIELRDILEAQNLKAIAAGAFAAEHSFSKTLGQGRPDADDMMEVEEFAKKICQKIRGKQLDHPVWVKGVEHPYRGYYKPQDRNGNHIDIRKVKPVTDENLCSNCGTCVELCPMGSINKENPSHVEGICMKCCGCIKKCPVNAKYFDDPGFIYHKEELEEVYQRRAENEIFLEVKNDCK